MRNAFSTPYTSETREEDEDIETYEPVHEVQEVVHEPEAEIEEEPPVFVPEPVVPVSVPAAEKPAMRQSGRVRNKPDWYGFPPQILHISMGPRLAVVL